MGQTTFCCGVLEIIDFVLLMFYWFTYNEKLTSNTYLILNDKVTAQPVSIFRKPFSVAVSCHT